MAWGVGVAQFGKDGGWGGGRAKNRPARVTGLGII